jgi:hypothetical protein
MVIKMRLKPGKLTIVKPYTKDLWLSIWKPHVYSPQKFIDYCVICNHSRYWHKQNTWSEPKPN